MEEDVSVMAQPTLWRLPNYRCTTGRFNLAEQTVFSTMVAWELTSGHRYFYDMTSTLEKEVWYHVAATQKSGSTKLYVNGIQVAETNNVADLKAPYPHSDSSGSTFQSVPASFSIGSWTDWWGYPGCIFNGSIDDVRFYNRSLDGIEIKELYDEFAAVDIEDGLVGHYKLDGNVQDSSTNGYDGVAYNATPVDAGVDGGCYNFNGQNTAIVYQPRDVELQFPAASDLTLSCWVKIRDYNRVNTALTTIIAMDSGRDVRSRSSIGINTAGIPIYGARIDSKPKYLWASDGLKTNTWYHLAARHIGEGVSLFVNGEKVVETNDFGFINGPHNGYDSGGWTLPFQNLAVSFSIGSWTDYWGYPGCIFNGLVDDVRYYNRALGDNEITQLYEMCTAVTEPEISNVAASQRTGTKLVDITYDLIGGNSSEISIALVVQDGDTILLCDSVSGDVGAGVSAGTGRAIVWDAGADWDGNLSEDLIFTVVVLDAEPPDGMALVPGGINEGINPVENERFLYRPIP